MNAQVDNPLQEVERRGEMVQLGMAAASAAGLLSVLSIGISDRFLWWASLLFSIGIPTALGRALMTFTALASRVYLNPTGWLMYPIGFSSCAATAFGYIMISFHISAIHGMAFCAFSILAVLLMYIHLRLVIKEKKSEPNQ